MKHDRTNWQCDRCKKVVAVELGANPDPGGWWQINVHALQNQHTAPRPDKAHDLCSECVRELDRWLREPPAQAEADN